MTDIYLLTGLILPPGVAHESLPEAVTRFMSDCWQGMSRTQMRARAKRRGLRLSFRAIEPREAGGTGMFELRFMDGAVECLTLALLQRLAAAGGPDRKVGRSDVSRPPERDTRQTSLF